MKTTLSFDEILELGKPQLQEMQRIGDIYPSANASEGTFSRQVRIVEGIVTQSYGAAAALARKAEDLNEVAEIWKRMSLFCQSALNILTNLKQKDPGFGTPDLYDLVLDYQLACDKRYQGVMEELAWQNESFPKGLFPELN